MAVEIGRCIVRQHGGGVTLGKRDGGIGIRAQQRRVDQIPLADPLTVTAEDQPHPGDDLAVPQTLLLRLLIVPFRDAVGGLERSVRVAEQDPRQQRLNGRPFGVGEPEFRGRFRSGAGLLALWGDRRAANLDN
jgi:hypothetical protein